MYHYVLENSHTLSKLVQCNVMKTKYKEINVLTNSCVSFCSLEFSLTESFLELSGNVHKSSMIETLNEGAP